MGGTLNNKILVLLVIGKKLGISKKRGEDRANLYYEKFRP
jgi:hypothetical protein